jgi:integrase
VASGVDRVFLDCYLNTGARSSEIFGLTWNDVNFEKQEIRLWTRKTRDGSWENEWPPMNQELCRSLKWRWNNRTFRKASHVFVDEQPGAHYRKPFLVRRRFMKGLCEKAGVKPFGFLALRRYVASIFADKHKASSKKIQQILRHKNVRTTGLYIQNINDDLRGCDGPFGDTGGGEKF